MIQAIQMREAHFPDRAAIDAYGQGGFRFANMSHRGSILCLPSGIYGWEPNTKEWDFSDLHRIVEEADKIEILLFGTGDNLQPLPQTLRQELRALGISVDVMSTGAAVRTFNVLLAEERAVAAALVAIK